MLAGTPSAFHPPDSGGRSAAARRTRAASTRRRDAGARARRWRERAVARRLRAVARQRSLVGGGGELFAKAFWFERSAHVIVNEEPGEVLLSLVRVAFPIAERAG